MRMRFIPLSLLMAIWLTGCSSISMPSIPWPVSAKPDPTADALYEEGTRYLAEKRYVRAIDLLTKLKTEHPFSPQVTDAELKIADAYYLNQQYPEAITAFKEFQSLHPTNENIPFVVYRLGQAYLDQFTSIDRDQKNTEIAKGYFENVIQNYPKSSYAIEARDKLGKAVGYLAEHEFNIATFYMQQEKYPAARERFEEIVRKYRGTPVAARSLFFLGESYRKEKNNVKASLAYEALIQYYPDSKFVPEAKTHLAQLEKEKQDPLAMLLMRDRRPAAPAAVESAQQTASNAKLKDADNVVAKTEVVYEEPGDEKGIFRRVVDKINPFGSSGDDKKKPEDATDVAAKKNASDKQESPGIVASLWNSANPFGGQDAKATKNKPTGKNDQLVNQIDDSLNQKGIDSQTQTASLKPPASELPKDEAAAVPPQTMDTDKLLGDIDANLKKSGKNVEAVPTPPEAHPAFKDPATAETVTAKTKATREPPPQDGGSSGLLSSIDQKLKSQGLEPSKFEEPPTPDQMQSTARQEPVKKVELEPKVAVEKGPLFLPSTEVRVQEKPASVETSTGLGAKPEPAQPPQTAPAGNQEFPRVLVQGPGQPQPGAKTAEQRKPLPGQEEEKGIFDQLKSDVDNVGKLLNPFAW
jgi:outer membrane protein assembly factor BamD